MSDDNKAIIHGIYLATTAVLVAVCVYDVFYVRPKSRVSFLPPSQHSHSPNFHDVSSTISSINEESASSSSDEDDAGDLDDSEDGGNGSLGVNGVVIHQTIEEIYKGADISFSPSNTLDSSDIDEFTESELQDLEFEVIEENNASTNLLEEPIRPASSQVKHSACEIVKNVQTLWCPFKSSMVRAFKCVYDRNFKLGPGAAERYINTESPLWTNVPVHTYYMTGGGRTTSSKRYFLAYSESLFSYPTVMITFPGMELCVADLKTVLSFMASTDRGTDLQVHAGFDAAASSCFPEIVRHIDTILKEKNVKITEVQILCCGHSLGGAIASLCAYRLVRHYYAGNNAQNNVVVFSMGQPKTMKTSSVGQFTRVVLEKNYVRFVTYGTYGGGGKATNEYSKGSTAKDPITGFRRVHKNAPDSIGMMHAGTEVMINSGLWLKNEPFVSAKYRQIAVRGGANVVLVAASTLFTGKERYSLHGQVVYFTALENYTREMHASLLNTHHSGRYCNSKFILWQEKWWDCCGKPNFDAPFCQPAEVRRHTGSWHSVRRKWDCCKSRDRFSVGCNGNNFVHHHPGRYCAKHRVYFCCGSTNMKAIGCKTGQPRHHPKQWATVQAKWSCCGNKFKASIGCTPGL